MFAAVFGSGSARDAYMRTRARGSAAHVVFRSESPRLLGLPWELMSDPERRTPLALDLAGLDRSLPGAELLDTFRAAGERLRVLMVISRPAGAEDVGYRMIARRLLERLDAVRGQVDLVVLRPPTLDSLQEALGVAVAAGEPFQVVHFDGHGVLVGREVAGSGAPPRFGRPAPVGVLTFEKLGGGPDYVPASRVAEVLKAAQVPVVVLNACQSGAVGKEFEAAVATRLLQEGAASVVAMAYDVYAVAAAEFMTAFYDRLFAGDSVTAAVSAGRRRLFQSDQRPSPRGDMALADWVVPVHYLRREVRFPHLRTGSAARPALEEVLDRLRGPDPQEVGGVLDPVGPFTGRDALFFELEVAAQLSRVVVLHGPAGTGKTELAKAFGRWWQDTGGVEQRDWLFWHSFEPGVPSFGLDGVITEIGLVMFGTDFARVDPAEQRAMVREVLDERRTLLIWDNFETVRSMPDSATATEPLDEAGSGELRGFLRDLTGHGRSAVIITSRTAEDWLGDVRRIEVGGLTPHEAAEYAGNLLASYPAAGSRRGTRAFGELMEWLDGHPLSMRLILPCLNRAGPEALLDGLRGTASLPGGGGIPEARITSLPASIAYSFTHLAQNTRRLLPAVCLFYGVADARVLGVFSEVPGVPGRFRAASAQEWLAALEDAARVGLLARLGAGTYRIHPALPAYLAARWRRENPGDYDAVRDAATRALLSAHATFGIWLEEQISAGNAALAYAILGLQRCTFGSLLGYALGSGVWDEAQDIAQPLGAYWTARGMDEEADGWADRVRLATEDPDGRPPELESAAGALWLFFTGSQAGRQMGRLHLGDAEKTYRQILAMLQVQSSSPQQQRSLGGTFHQLGTVAYLRGRPDDAEDWYRRSLAIHEDLADRPHIAGSYHQLGMAAEGRGRLDDAEDWYRKSLAIHEDLGDQPHIAQGYDQLGEVAQRRGRLDDAEDWYHKSLAIHEDLGNRPHMASTYHQLGTVAYLRGRLHDAEDWFRRSLAIYEDLGDRPHMATSYHQLGMADHGRGQLDDAEDWYRKSLAIREDLGDKPGVATSYHQLGIAAQDRGQLDDAEDWYRKSLAIHQDLGDRSRTASNYLQLGTVAYLRRRLDDAEDWYRKSLAIHQDLGDKLGMAGSYHQLGVTAVERGHLDDAEDRCRKSMSIYEAVGDRPHIASNYQLLGNVAYLRGQLDDAEDWYQKSLDIREVLGDLPGMAPTFWQLSQLAEDRGQARLALVWMVRRVALSVMFSHTATGAGLEKLTRLTARLGIAALEECWQDVTGSPLPHAIRGYIEGSRPETCE